MPKPSIQSLFRMDIRAIRRASPSVVFLLCALCYARAGGEIASNNARPNVLLICVDDLRPELGCFGVDGIQTPNIDRLAAEGRLFKRHYVQAALCGPSRCSMLTGRRIVQSWDIWKPARNLKSEPAEPVSMPHLFRQAGYRTVCVGKVSHEPGGRVSGRPQVPFSWDVVTGPTGPWKDSTRAFFGYANGDTKNRQPNAEVRQLPYEAADVDDFGYPDAWTAKMAVEQLRDCAQRDKPFFLAVGFFKPHLPFSSPKKYWDLYRREEIPPAPWPKPPTGVDGKVTLHDSFEPTAYYRWPEGRGNVGAEQARALKHGYWAAVSYVDTQLGKLLDEYRRSGLEKNTIVVLWSDHGWHLGDHGIWGKFTNHELSLRSPLIVRTPAINQPGESANGIVEAVDLYPTLADLCGLNAPADLPGISLRPLINDPASAGKAAALGAVRHESHLGRTLRTDRYRLVEWTKTRNGEVTQVELYDHHTDPLETTNIAEQQPAVVAEMSQTLRAEGANLGQQ